jgi:ABC-2 type transport system ATP-binding protein
MSIAVHAAGLRKRLGADFELEVDLSIPAGSICGVIGRNGAGKTSLLQILMGFMKPDQGNVEVLGQDPWKSGAHLRRNVSYVADTPAVEGWMKVREYLDMLEGLVDGWDRDKADDLLSKAGIVPEKKIRALSRGMKGKLYLYSALCMDTQLLILDEPTLGFDIIAEEEFIRDLLDSFFTKEKTIIISSNQISLLENILDRVVFLEDGKVICDEQIEGLKSRFGIGLVEDGDQLEGIQHWKMESIPGHKLYFFEKSKEMHLQAKEPGLREIFKAYSKGGIR